MGLLIRIGIVAARNLPIMDSLTQSADSYVIVSHHSKIITRTQIAKKSLNPKWDHDYRYEISDPSELQDYVLEFKVWDHDIVSSDHVIGSVLMVVEQGFEGWMPIYDSLKGYRGELYISITLESLGDVNPWKVDSQNVQIFSCNDLRLFEGATLGASVEELLVDEDPEHTWMDNFRSSRTSNEQRQQIFYKLSGKLRRKMGKKAGDQGYNAIIGFQERFDLEEDNGIIVRGFGTLANISKFKFKYNPVSGDLNSQNSESPNNRSPRAPKSSWSHSSMKESFHSPPKSAPLWKRAEILLCTLKHFEKNRIKRIGGLVTAKSVKLCHKLEKNRRQLAKIHDTWWNELRDEIKSHARTLHCNHVIGYEENMYIYRDVCILWASGTAAVLRAVPKKKKRHCKLLHIPFVDNRLYNQEFLFECETCDKNFVPELLLSTIETPEEVVTRGEGILIEARVIRKKKNKTKEEELAKYVSYLLPFIEFDLHKQLLHKLKLYGMNMAWNYKCDYAISQDLIICTCTVQACRSVALPRPVPLEFHRARKIQDQEDEQMFMVQQFLERISTHNIKKLDNSSLSVPRDDSNSDSDSSTDSDEDDNRDDNPSVVELRDDTDDDQMACLLVSAFPQGVYASSFVSRVPSGIMSPISNLQQLLITKRYKLMAPPDKLNQYLTALHNDINRELAYRVQHFVPCLLAGFRNKIEIYDRELQIQTSANVILLGDSTYDLNAYMKGNDLNTTQSSDSDSDDRFEDLRPPLLNENIKSTYRKVYDDIISKEKPRNTIEVRNEDQVTDEIFSMEQEVGKDLKYSTANRISGEMNYNQSTVEVGQDKELNCVSIRSSGDSDVMSKDIDPHVHITNLNFIPGYQVKRLHHRVYIHFLRESDNVVDPAYFLEEIYSQARGILRKQVLGSKCNAILGFEIHEHSLILNTIRRQAYGLITCVGDMAEIVPCSHERGKIGSEIISCINMSLNMD